MKSKKLFAILTLVAFMMTLVPAFAFAEDAVAYSAAASKVKVDDTTIDVYDAVDGEADDMAMFTLTFKDGSNAKLNNKEVVFYAQSDSDALVGFVTNNDEDEMFADGAKLLSAAEVGSKNGQAFTATTNGDGELYVFATSGVTGTFRLSFYNGPADDDDNPGKLIGEAKVTVEVGDGGAIELTIDADGNTGAGAGDPDYVAEIGDEITLKAVAVDAANNELEGATIIFKKSYQGGSYTTIAEVETDEDGIAELDVEETRAGNYRYQAILKSDKDVNSNVGRSADADFEDVSVKWVTDGIAKIVAKTADNTKIALDEKYDLEFYVYDSQGYLIKNEVECVEIEVIDQPKDGDADKLENGTYGSDADGIVTIPFTPDEEGTYEFKVMRADKSSVKTTLTVVCQEFGEAAEMKVELANDQPSVMYGADKTTDDDDFDGALNVTLIDEDGVELDYTGDSELRYGSSDRDAVEVNDDGEIIVTDDEFTGEVTITVIDNESGVTGEYTLNVVGKAVAINPVVTVNGKRANVELQYVDKNGARTFSGTADKLRLVLPSKVTSEGVTDFDATEGNTKFELVASEAGEYTIIANSDLGITKSFKVAFEVPASEKVVVGAKNVTMFIGNAAYVQDGVAKVTDVAPFIKDNRTFVAIRPVADAFGCEIGWDEATQTVTLTRDDLTVTIVIGSSDILVVKDGVTSTVTADVPAFIQDGRTVLPFRAIGNAFGATVNYDAATQSVSYIQ